MALQFRPYPPPEPVDFRQMVTEPLTQGLNTYLAINQQGQQQEYQKLLMQLAQAKEAREAQAAQSDLLKNQAEYGTPAAAPYDWTGGMAPASAQPPQFGPQPNPALSPAPTPAGGMVARFRQWQQSQRSGQPAQGAPEAGFFPRPAGEYQQTAPEVPGYSREQILGVGGGGMAKLGTKQLEQLPKLFAANAPPILKSKIISGEVTEIPKGSRIIDDMPTPTNRGSQFVGIQNGQAVVFDPNTQTLSLRPLPAAGPISPKVPPLMPEGQLKAIGDVMNMKEKLNVIKQNYSPDFVGMYDARKQAVAQKTGIGASSKAAYFRQAIQDIKDSLLRARSGAQINEQEYQRLLPIVPNEYSSEVDFEAKLARFEQVLDDIIRSKQQTFQTAGYNTPNFMGGSVPTGDSGTIRVRNKQTGQTGQLPAASFDPSRYDRL